MPESKPFVSSDLAVGIEKQELGVFYSVKVHKYMRAEIRGNIIRYRGGRGSFLSLSFNEL